ncbi:MAG: bifunctional methylenetetrahydrofolate dehydrogenase/methenyltetrahydrofolate cyclohydrolase [Gammaproteobacteria bacterium RIFCSPHIGHO2_12_FULL_35_23]|nr:MAG: bifunctional methylenetetrahydrofolate dehydrogenase/methenyltetrahydrofolate cyclohydrolase [Gammaproteobacteria bacterium RIFCSPHIGHO2_12_FULL_35_23]
MTAVIIDGKKLAQALLESVKKKITQRIKKGLSRPGLAVILVGNDPASEVYVKRKHEACEQVGIQSFKYCYNIITEQKLTDLIRQLNKDPAVHGILVQLPLPTTISTKNIIEAIDPQKDVDGFHPYNIGRLLQRRPLLRPCTPLGIMHILLSLNVDLMGRHAVIIGASNIVGRPMALELLLAGCTITVCHRHTRDLASYVKQGDIIISAVGKPGLIKGDWIKLGAVVIDVGITRLPNGHLTGDVDYDKAKERAGWITPVPGGVGPMTVAMLISNTLQAALP